MMNKKVLKAVFTLFAVTMIVAMCCPAAHAKKRTYAKCEVDVEDPVWIYSSCKPSYDNHIGEYSMGKKFTVYETRNGMARIKFNGKNAWIGTKNLEVVKSGYVKIEGKWKRIKPGFSFWLFIKFGETGY